MRSPSDSIQPTTTRPFVEVMRPVINITSTFALRHLMRWRFPDPPIFIGGAPRSGTTLLISILATHPHIHAIDYETAAFHPEYRPEKLLSALLFEPDSRRWKRVAAGKRRYCEKTPGNIRHVDQLNELFQGRLRCINIVRDGRDVVTSRHPENPGDYWVPIKRWVRDVKFGLKAQNKGLALTIKYEDLVAEPLRVIRTICEYLDEPFYPAMMEYEKNDTPLTTITKHAWNAVARPINAASVRKWERPEHRARIEEFYNNAEAVSLLHQLGYE